MQYIFFYKFEVETWSLVNKYTDVNWMKKILPETSLYEKVCTKKPQLILYKLLGCDYVFTNDNIVVYLHKRNFLTMDQIAWVPISLWMNS